ncbi:MAG: YceI family protein [Bdellovibrionota bacterium]|nr:YceI family protein [Bdellovibrionota bacterium]
MKYFVLLTLLALPSWANQCLELDKDTFSLKFTGYKFTEKAGVTGEFKNTQFSAPSKGQLSDILSNAMIFIDTTSIDAGNEARNTNISSSLFKTLVDGHSIRAIAKKIDTNENKLFVDLYMGRKIQEVVLNYSYNKNLIKIDGSIDLLKLGFNKAFEALANKCGPLHTGKDGKAKTWSDVAINLSIKTKQCK